ncbi:hypothetical protein [Desulfitobacterium sp.]|uniref:hypothetical protein n=1 Tax=Desulfitobacterium sp. TaxID=49981 RepID=UPI002C7206F6|nr:hypothetical protein [Desulfitobacterium sp.]HVJ47729.1 hypothetical protein [Desulfitobacterium sp.]
MSRRSMLKYGVVLFVLLIVVCVFYWIQLNSDISPTDINLSAKMNAFPSDQSITYTDKNELVITLDSSSKKPLVDKTKGYFYTIYIYTPLGYRFLDIKGPNNSLDNISIGYDSRTGKKAIKALINNNVVSGENEVRLTIADGFTYNDKVFPISLRYNFSHNKQLDDNQKFYVIFSYYQEKHFKNLSWTKILELY